MANLTIELNSAGVRELLLSDEMAAILEQEARKMTRATGVRYEPDVYYGKNRANAIGVDAASKFDTPGADGNKDGKKVNGYWRKGKNGKMIWVDSYQRRK